MRAGSAGISRFTHDDRKGGNVSQITTPRELFLHELGDIMYVDGGFSHVMGLNASDYE